MIIARGKKTHLKAIIWQCWVLLHQSLWFQLNFWYKNAVFLGSEKFHHKNQGVCEPDMKMNTGTRSRIHLTQHFIFLCPNADTPGSNTGKTIYIYIYIFFYKIFLYHPIVSASGIFWSRGASSDLWFFYVIQIPISLLFFFFFYHCTLLQQCPQFNYMLCYYTFLFFCLLFFFFSALSLYWTKTSFSYLPFLCHSWLYRYMLYPLPISLSSLFSILDACKI